MSAAPAFTLVLTALTVLVIAGYLIAISIILKRVFDNLEIILPAVSAVSEKSAPAGDVIAAINADLAAGHAALDGAVQRLEERRAADDAMVDDDPAVAPSAGRSSWFQR